jgi:hypothetical protein
VIRALVEWVASKLPNPRVIYDQSGRDAYLSRYYLVGAPTHPDGGSPFDQFGDVRPGTKWGDKSWGLYLHRFHRGDADPELHNHPWSWAVSLVLAGGYLEERRVGLDVVQRVLEPGALNFIRGDTYHRVDLLERDAWTLFLVGPKTQSWGFWNRGTWVTTPWREFISAKRDPAAFAREQLDQLIADARRELATLAIRRSAS